MSDWQEASLAELAEYINGRAIKPEECSTQQGIPVIRIKQINDPQSIEDRFCGDDLDEKNIARSGDLLFSWSATLKTILWQGPTGAINQHIFKVLPKEGIDKTFLHYLIDYSIPALTEESHGSTMKHIKKSALSAFHLQIPPLTEQKKIAEILSANQRIASALQSKATLLQQLISAVRDDAFQRYKDSGAIEEYSIADLVDAGDLLSIQDGNHGEKHPKASEFRAEGIPFIMASHIREGRFQPDPSKCLSREIVSGLRIGHSFPGDVLLTHKATIGETCVVPANHEEIMLSPQVTLYRLKRDSHITPEFLREWFMSTTFQKEISEMSGQSTRDYIGIKAQQKLHVMVPRDRGIADAITRSISPISNSLRLLSAKLSSTARLQSSLTNDLLSGRKRVSV